MEKKLVRLSKFISLVLRHKPEQIGLTLDPNGWADVDELLAKANSANVALDLKQLQQVVDQNNKQRFVFSDDGRRIRANQGHSINIDLGLAPIAPPSKLYHGTAERFLKSIRAIGVIARSRQHVHLSLDQETAQSVGKRHGKPVILTVAAKEMHHAGYDFFRSKNGVWLTNKVPTAYLTFPK